MKLLSIATALLTLPVCLASRPHSFLIPNTVLEKNAPTVSRSVSVRCMFIQICYAITMTTDQLTLSLSLLFFRIGHGGKGQLTFLAKDMKYTKPVETSASYAIVLKWWKKEL